MPLLINENNDSQVKTAESVSSEEKSGVIDFLVTCIALFGSYIHDVFILTVLKITNRIYFLFKKIWKNTNWFRIKIKTTFLSVLNFIFYPITHTVKQISEIRKNIRHERHEKNLFSAIFLGLKYSKRIMFGSKGIAVTLFNYIAPVISIVFLFNVVAYSTNMNYAVKLSINGNFVGYIANEQVYSDAEHIMQQRITYMENNTPIELNPEFVIERIGYQETLSKYYLADLMIKNMDADIAYAYGLYIGEQYYGSVLDKAPIENTLENLLNEYRTENPTEVVNFVANISYAPGLYLTESIVDADQLIAKLTSYKTVSAYYTVVDDDTPIGIAEKLGINYEEIKALNPNIEESLYVGDLILMNRAEPFLSVSITRTEQYEEAIDYETIKYDDSARFVGAQTITQEGEEGVSLVTVDVSYVNGYEMSRKVLNKTTVVEPIPKKIAVGTKPVPKNMPVSTATAPIGQFIWPVGGGGGYISEYMYGYPGHKGIDIAGVPYQTAIFAGASGTVIQAGWYYDYGKCVMIQHGNGVVTLYGHASDIFVVKGQQVTQGEAIAAIGSTGRSTGNHLHFEVRSGNTFLNPINYLPRSK